MSDALKAIIYWAISLVLCLIGMIGTTVLVYTFLDVAGLFELGQMPIFQLGLALTECGTYIWTASELSETILHGDEDIEEDQLEIFEELD